MCSAGRASDSAASSAAFCRASFLAMVCGGTPLPISRAYRLAGASSRYSW